MIQQPKSLAQNTNGSNSENAYYNALYNAFGQMTVSYEKLEDGQIVEVKDKALDSTRQRYDFSPIYPFELAILEEFIAGSK